MAATIILCILFIIGCYILTLFVLSDAPIFRYSVEISKREGFLKFFSTFFWGLILPASFIKIPYALKVEYDRKGLFYIEKACRNAITKPNKNNRIDYDDTTISMYEEGNMYVLECNSLGWKFRGFSSEEYFLIPPYYIRMIMAAEKATRKTVDVRKSIFD